jgi:methionyl-tRNA formyltransferase
MKKKLNLIFMGTPDFAIPALKAVSNEHNILAVYTQAPKAVVRGKKLTRSQVHELADVLGLNVKTPEKLRSPEVVEEIKLLNPDAIIVCAYGHIISKKILEIPKFGCINIHPSLLPRWRGAAPVERTIEAGDQETAVCIMKMDEGLDTGDILMQENFPVPNKITALEFLQILAQHGANLLVKVLTNLQNLKPIKQKSEGFTYAKKLEKWEGLINWQTSSAIEIERRIRAFNPWPYCYFQYKNEAIRIISAEIIDENSQNFAPGTVINKELHIQCSSGVIAPKILQRPGKNQVDVRSFLNGFKIEIFEKL